MGTGGNRSSRSGFPVGKASCEIQEHPKGKRRETPMSDFKPGLEGVIAFETEIAEPDKEGGALRYRGVDIEELVGHVSYGHVWGLRQLLDITDEQAREDLARASVMALSFVAQAARGVGLPMVPQRRVDQAATIAERFMIRWRGEPDPRHVKAVDAYWTSAAEHGMNASTFTARVIASTGADVAAALSGAVGAMSGPLHGGAPARARLAGRRTSWSRSAPGGWSGRARAMSARRAARSGTCPVPPMSWTKMSDQRPGHGGPPNDR